MGTSPLVPHRNSLHFEERLNKEVGRCTAFTFIFWVQDDHEDPESSKIYWCDYLYTFLSNLKIPSAVSPIHDQDVNEFDFNTGEVEYKKPHFHVVIDFGSGNNKTIKQVFDLISPIRNYISICPWDNYRLDSDSLVDASPDYQGA